MQSLSGSVAAGSVPPAPLGRCTSRTGSRPHRVMRCATWHSQCDRRCAARLQILHRTRRRSDESSRPRSRDSRRGQPRLRMPAAGSIEVPKQRDLRPVLYELAVDVQDYVGERELPVQRTWWALTAALESDLVEAVEASAPAGVGLFSEGQ